MALDALTPTTAEATPPRTWTQQRNNVLRAAGRTVDVNTPAGRQQAAAMLVSEIGFKPLLAEMRKLPFGEQFHGGRAEDMFGEQLDQRLADTVALADRSGLTASFARYFEPPAQVAPMRPDGTLLAAGKAVSA